jgi:hypothetical protein
MTGPKDRTRDASRPTGQEHAPDTPRAGLTPALLAAALALPGVAPPQAAHAAPPERAQLDVRYLRYQDSQPGLKRITASSPSIGLRVPLNERWSFEGAAVYDSVSGASPRWHSAVSSASRMQDDRRAGDVRVTRHWDRATLTVGAAGSSEHDYRSRAMNVLGTLSSEDNNRTWSLGLGRASDRIDPVNGIVVGERKRTADLLLGVTQVLTPTDIVQLNVTYARGEGYYSDPYKSLDNRPRERRQTAILARWNHFFEPLGATLRTGYRHYTDSWNVASHTLTGEWVQPVAGGWTLTPSLRYYTQRAASFYYDAVYDPVLGAPFPTDYLANPNAIRSPDARLSAYGAATVGLRVSKALDRSNFVDFKIEYYEQRAQWRLGGEGSPGLDPLRATIFQIGLTHLF